MNHRLPIVAVVGRANVGKSSLFNAILGRRETIVAREPGTTRDSIAAIGQYKGRPFWLVDTAGLKDPEDDFEISIQDQISQAADSADALIVVTEADVPLTEEDRRVVELALKSKKPALLAINKIDRAKNADLTSFERLGLKPVFKVSATHKRGLDNLLSHLVESVPPAKLKRPAGLIRVALVGRPNVGKSYLFNALANKQQAIVSSKAGTTRDLNRAEVSFKGKPIEFIDTAGIRRSGKIKVGVEKFSVLRALSGIEQADVCLVLMDVNEHSVQLDQKIAGLVNSSGRGLILVIAKWDIYEGKDPYSRDKIAAQIKNSFDFVPFAPLIFTSALSGQNVTKIYDLVLDIYQERQRRIPTPQLNRWLRQATDGHPPAGLKGFTPKLTYMMQEADNPIPAFKIFASHARFVHWSYRRYLETKLRQSFGFNGTPVQLWFIDKSKQAKGVKNGLAAKTTSSK